MKEPGLQQIKDLGKKDTAAATGAVTETDYMMAYVKQCVTNGEAILVILGGAAGQLRTAQSISAGVEENAFQQFSISLMDFDSGAIASASIDITSISQVLEKSTGGGAFSVSGITQPTFGKTDGRVFEDYQFLADEWAVGDVYKLVVSGITCTVGGDTAYIPAMVWCNFVVEHADVKTAVDAIKAILETGAGKDQVKNTTISLNQGEASYDLFTGATQDVILESLVIKMPTGDCGGSLTSISIQTDDVTPAVLINSTDGAVANLKSEAEIYWIGAVHITVATKVQLTIAGGAHGSAYTCKVTAKYRAITAGGVLS